MSGLLPDAQISTSSSRDVVWNPGSTRLVASRSGWFPAPAQPLAGEEWLQVDFAFIVHYFKAMMLAPLHLYLLVKLKRSHRAQLP